MGVLQITHAFLAKKPCVWGGVRAREENSVSFTEDLLVPEKIHLIFYFFSVDKSLEK